MGRNPTRYRALLPTTTPHSGQALSASSTSADAPGPDPDPVAKRKATRIACRECHEKKRKCDGQKPSCAACKRDGQNCIYRAPANENLRNELETLRGRYEVLESFVTKLRVAPHAGALDALHQLRSSTSGWPENLDTLTQRPQPASSSDFSELTQDQVSSGEEACHMDLEQPGQVASSDQRRWFQDRESASPSNANLGLVNKASDPRLKGLNIAFWTEVPVTDIFARDAISSYLRSDHEIWELFDADAFLSDLVSQKSEFCSAFLVNCLLAFASQTYAASYPSATSKGFQFEEAAGALWKVEATRLDSETALTGLILLYLCFAARWESDNAGDCIRQILEMAIRMKLFGVEERVSDFDMSLLKADRRSSMIHAAWGAFNTMSMHRKRLLDDVLLLPPLVMSPSMASSMAGESGDKDLSMDPIVETDSEP